MMPSMEGRASSARIERREGKRKSDQAKTTNTSESRREFPGDVRIEECLSKTGQASVSVEGAEHAPVTFWTSDGSQREGTTPRVNGEMLFVESKRMVPVGGELTISLPSMERQSAEQELAEGVVMWHCPLGDEFENQGGFGVRIQKHWPKGPGSDLVGGPKEPT